MQSVFAVTGLAVIAFLSTNVDDMFVLVAFFANPNYPARHIVTGQFFGIAALFAVSVAGAQIALIIPPTYIGLLGLFPLAIGLKELWDLRRNDEDQVDAAREPAIAGRAISVAIVTIANGGDNIAVYVPLFAGRSNLEIGGFGIVFAVMTALWCGVAHWLVNHQTAGTLIRRYGRYSTPFVLIALGALILAQLFGGHSAAL